MALLMQLQMRAVEKPGSSGALRNWEGRCERYWKGIGLFTELVQPVDTELAHSIFVISSGDDVLTGIILGQPSYVRSIPWMSGRLP